MAREQRVVQSFVEFAGTLVKEFDPIDFLHLVAERCVELLDCAEAGVLLADTAGVLQVMASSSERSDALELLQTQNDEGPCCDCYHRAELIASGDLRVEADRWPLFAPAAVGAGFVSVHAVPMRVGELTIGALNLFRTTAGELAEVDRPLSQGLADMAAIALVQQRQVQESHETVRQLQNALQSRVLIEQAKGRIAEAAGISMDAAFALLRDHARAHNRRLSLVAGDVVERRLGHTALTGRRTGTPP